jgi:hypothetical protein
MTATLQVSEIQRHRRITRKAGVANEANQFRFGKTTYSMA